jgi:hypothetical protein
MRAAGHGGLSVIGRRPGTPALMLAVGGTLHLSPVAVTAGLEVALGVAVGLASCAFARACEGARRAAWVLAGALSGLFAVHLVAGYLSNLIFAVGFLAACAAVAAGRRRATVAAALLLGAGGLAHPQFFVPGAAILALVAAWALFVRHDSGEFARLAWTVGGAAAVLGAGLLSMLFGAAGLTPDTSRDGFLRRVGLGDVVRSAYVDRFVHRWTRYVQWVSLPLAGAGYLRARGTGGRILRAWLVVIVAGIPVGLLTGWFPADRLITFGYAVPILAAFGVVWLYARLAAGRAGARWAAAVCGLALVLMAAGSFIAWHRQDPFITAEQTDQLEVLNRYVSAAPPHVPIVVRVDSGDETATFAALQAANVIRASVPPDRIADVHIVVDPFTADGSPPDDERRLLSEVTTREARAAIADAGGRALLARVDAFFSFALTANVERPADGAVVVPNVRIAGLGFRATAAADPVDPLAPSSPTGIVIASVAALALMWAVGYGWARTTVDRTAAMALAPVFGLSALILAAVVADRVGLPLDGWVGPTAVSAVAGGGGYLLLFLLGAERETVADPPPQVEE